MRQIEMVDLRTQYAHIKTDIDAAIQQVLETVSFINGPAVKSFATHLQEYLNVKHIIPCANGTDALQIAMMALDLQPGDEVITPTFTYIATFEVMALLKLKPVFVDCDPRTFNIDPVLIEKAITPRTKAIVPVHLYGQSADMEPILAISKKYNIPVIEDNAQAIGAVYTFADGTRKMTGTMGLMAGFSFFPSKNLGGYGDGGAISTNDDELATKLRMVCNHGQRIKYYHDTVGVNSRLDSIQAAILDVKLRHLDAYKEARQKAAAYYDKAFAGVSQIITPYVHPSNEHVYHQYTMQVEKRDELLQYLTDKHIPAMIYYPVCAHMQKAYIQYGFKEGDFPVSEALAKKVLSLPMHTELDEAQLQYVTQSVIEFYTN